MNTAPLATALRTTLSKREGISSRFIEELSPNGYWLFGGSKMPAPAKKAITATGGYSSETIDRFVNSKNHIVEQTLYIKDGDNFIRTTLRDPDGKVLSISQIKPNGEEIDFSSKNLSSISRNHCFTELTPAIPGQPDGTLNGVQKYYSEICKQWLTRCKFTKTIDK